MDTRLLSGAHFLVCLIVCLTARPHLSYAILCPKNQTAELGDQGYIHCNFTEDLHEVYWFDNVSDSSPPVVHVQFRGSEEAKHGLGFESGEYDVGEDGSLIITNVTTRHEGKYRVIVFKKGTLTPDTFFISLHVLASPVDDLPLIHCHNCHQEHFYSVMQGETLHCSFNSTRPPVQLEWIEQLSGGYEHVEIQEFSTSENSNGSYNSIATLHLLKDSHKFNHLLVCRATWSQSNWTREKKILFDFSGNMSSDVTPVDQYLEISKHFEIQCGQSTSIYRVWKQILSNNELEVIGFQSHVMTDTISSTLDVEVSAEGSLIFSSPRVQHEGIYACIYGDGQKEEIQMTALKLLIPPSPPYIQITGCDDDGHRCVIREDSAKNLTCAVYGARPSVTLEWITEDEDVSFFNHQLVSKERGGTSDTILSVEYKVSQDVLCGEEILIKCHLYGPLSNIMKAESTALVIPASCRENEGTKHGLIFGIGFAVFYILILGTTVVAVGLIVYRKCIESTTSSYLYSGVPPIDNQDTSSNFETRESLGEIVNGTQPHAEGTDVQASNV